MKRVFSEDSTGDWDEGTLQSLRWIRFWIRFLRDLSAHLGKRTREDGYDLDFKELPHLVQQQSTAQRFEAAGRPTTGQHSQAQCVRRHTLRFQCQAAHPQVWEAVIAHCEFTVFVCRGKRRHSERQHDTLVPRPEYGSTMLWQQDGHGEEDDCCGEHWPLRPSGPASRRKYMDSHLGQLQANTNAGRLPPLGFQCIS